MVLHITSTNCVWLDEFFSRIFYNYIFIYFFSFVFQHPQSQGGFESPESDADLGSTLSCVTTFKWQTHPNKQQLRLLWWRSPSHQVQARSFLEKKNNPDKNKTVPTVLFLSSWPCLWVIWSVMHFSTPPPAPPALITLVVAQSWTLRHSRIPGGTLSLSFNFHNPRSSLSLLLWGSAPRAKSVGQFTRPSLFHALMPRSRRH